MDSEFLVPSLACINPLKEIWNCGNLVKARGHVSDLCKNGSKYHVSEGETVSMPGSRQGTWDHGVCVCERESIYVSM